MLGYDSKGLGSKMRIGKWEKSKLENHTNGAGGMDGSVSESR